MSAISWMDDNFDASAEAENANDGDFEAIPAGEYEVEVISVEEREINNDRATGTGVNVQLKVCGPTHENRRLFEWFNVVYQSKSSDEKAREKADKTQRIGRGQFGALCVALGISKRPGSYDELVGKHARAKVGKRENTYKGDGSYENYVKSFSESQEYANPSRPKASAEESPWG